MFWTGFNEYLSLHYRMLPILGYEPNDLMEKSLYEYHHTADSESLMASFKNGEYERLKMRTSSASYECVI